LNLRPDLILEWDRRPVAVVDMKWKGWNSSGPLPPDFYQVVTYAGILGVERAVLVYAGKRDRLWSYPLGGNPVTVEVRCLRVTGSRQQCERSLRRLVGQLLRSR
jgi:hypothetical protein